MICPLYTLLPMYQNKKLYLWNVSRTSMILFTKIALMRIGIYGFVTTEKEYVGEMYMNRPVVDLSQAEDDADSIILISDDVPVEQIDVLPKDRVVYWSDALGLNQMLKNEKIIVYGTGYGAEQIDNLLGSVGLETELYCVTKREAGTRHKGKRVIEPIELEYYSERAIIISVKNEDYRKEILEVLSKYPGQIYIEHLVDAVAFFHLNLIQNIDLSIKKQKEIYLYGDQGNVSNLIEEMLTIYDIEVTGYVSDRDRADGTRNIYSIAFEGVENKFVIICEILPQKYVNARKNVELAGFSLEEQNYVGLEWYTASNDNLLGNLHQYFDVLVGMCYMYHDGKPGWKVYGEEDRDGVRIVVLGGSTSSEVFHVENWVSKLYYKLKQHNIEAVIYNGAHPADDIVDEVLRLLRDIYILKPDIVISMSGVNNLVYKESSNQFNEKRMLSWAKSFSGGKEYATGLENIESLFSFWYRTQKLLKAISDFYNASFIGFLQPMNITMRHMSLREKSLYEMDDRILGVESFLQAESNEYHYINLLRMFEHQDNMFIDAVHYTDRAQNIIADKVLEAVVSII